MNPISDTLRDSTVGRLVEAYRNPRLEDAEADYLNEEHRDELRDQSEIVHWEATAEPENYSVGIIQPVYIVTKQGYGYEGAIGKPSKQQSTSLGLATSPLGTSAKGYNRHLMLNYMRAGNYIGFIANEGSYQFDSEIKTRISTASSAAALLNFGYHLREELTDHGHDLHPKNRFTYGASRAGAIALLLNALDSDFAQNIQASDIIAPSPTLKLDSFEQWQQVIEQVAKEPAQTALIISRLGLKLALRYRKSISLNRNNLAHQLEICGGLFNGELNAATDHVPNKKLIRITEYDCDLACNDGGLEQRLSKETHPNISFEELSGIHMSIADRRLTFPHMMGFNKAFQEMEVGTVNDPQVFFERARDLASHQYPITKDQLPSAA